MKSTITLLVVVLTIGSACPVAADESGWHTDEIEFYTSDSLKMYGWLHVPNHGHSAPLYILLPMRGHAHDSYDLFLDSLSSRLESDSSFQHGLLPFVLALDLRGHGQSTRRMGRTIKHLSMPETDFQRIPKDVEEFTHFIAGDTAYQIDDEEVYLVGASIGANSAVMTAQLIPDVNRIAMLSPGEYYLGLQPAAAVKAATFPILIFVGQQDGYSRKSSEYLAGRNNDEVELVIFETGDHGTEIIDRHPAAMTRLLDWILK